MADQRDRREAFERMFETHYWAVRAFVLRRVGHSSAEDVVADTFLVAWRRFADLDGDPLPWLLGIARRVLANQLRAERRHGALAARMRTAIVSESGVWEPPVGMNGELAAALASLSARERDALLLVAWEGLDPSGAAQVMGCTATAFRVRLHRARRRIAQQLADRATNLQATQEVQCSSRTL
jgi:DNA-directed RNA polymerase specialized sigma24 family protein